MRALTLLLVTFFTVGAAVSPAGATDRWPSFQNGGQLRIEADNLPLTWSSAKAIAWNVALDGYGQSTPVIWSDSVYVTFCSGDMKEKLHVRALEFGSGETRWSHTLDNSSPEKNSNYVSKAAPSPVADDDGVIAFFEGGNLVALDHQGVVRWQRDLVKDYGAVTARHGLASSLEQDDRHVFVWVERSEAPYVLAVSKATGKTAWKVEGAEKTAWSSPRLVAVGDRQHLVLSAIGRIIGLDPASGQRLWRFEQVTNNTTPTPIPLGEGRFLIGASDGRGEQTAPSMKSNGIIQISKDKNGEYVADYLWRADKATTSFGSPIVAGNNAYFVNRAGVIYCLDAKTGKQHYAKRSAGSVWATPLHVGNRIYLFGRNGTTTVIGDGNEFELLAENTLWKAEPSKQPATGPGGFGGPVLYAAAVARNKIVLRRGDRVYCIGR